MIQDCELLNIKEKKFKEFVDKISAYFNLKAKRIDTYVANKNLSYTIDLIGNIGTEFSISLEDEKCEKLTSTHQNSLLINVSFYQTKTLEVYNMGYNIHYNFKRNKITIKDGYDIAFLKNYDDLATLFVNKLYRDLKSPRHKKLLSRIMTLKKIKNGN